MTERKWQMRRLGPGDWFLLSNDQRTAWRFTLYVDGPSLGLMDWPRDREVWWVRSMPAEHVQAWQHDHEDPDAAWRDEGGPFYTRRACIDYAMSQEPTPVEAAIADTLRAALPDVPVHVGRQ